jgi:hypothetical protein
MRQEGRMMQQTNTDLENYLKNLLQEFKAVELVLAGDAEWNSKFSAIGKVVLIILGAVVATKDVANQLWSANNIANTLIFTLAGLVIAVIAGLQAGFKWEQSATELKGLAGSCQKNIREGNYQLHRVQFMETDGEKRTELEKTIETLNKNLDEIYSKSEALGINVPLEIKHKLPADDVK